MENVPVPPIMKADMVGVDECSVVISAPLSFTPQNPNPFNCASSARMQQCKISNCESAIGKTPQSTPYSTLDPNLATQFKAFRNWA